MALLEFEVIFFKVIRLLKSVTLSSILLEGIKLLASVPLLKSARLLKNVRLFEIHFFAKKTFLVFLKETGVNAGHIK